MIDVQPLAIDGVKLITPVVHSDTRGFFLERYRQDVYREAGIENAFVQDNHSRSRYGTVRGLHFQRPPHAQAKLVSVVRGRIYDVAVDVRHGSPTFGRWVAAVLDDETMRQLLIPTGFAHGFAVMSSVADVVYKVDSCYAPSADAGLRWDDPALGIAWGVERAIVSEKDRHWPVLSELASGFSYARDSG